MQICLKIEDAKLVSNIYSYIRAVRKRRGAWGPGKAEYSILISMI
jgi:hypothetical protein